jgi:hypothetical protein
VHYHFELLIIVSEESIFEMKGEIGWLSGFGFYLSFELVGVAGAQDIVLSLTGSKLLQKGARVVGLASNLPGAQQHVRKTWKRWVPGQRGWLLLKTVFHGLG